MSKRYDELLQPHGAPPFLARPGRERTKAEMVARIEWEAWAAAEQRRAAVDDGERWHEVLAIAHDNTRRVYELLIKRAPDE